MAKNIEDYTNYELQRFIQTLDKIRGIYTHDFLRDQMIKELNNRGHIVIRTHFQHVIYWNGLKEE